MAHPIDFTEIVDGDNWELFGRDFFQALDYVIDIPPGRGPDGGRDLVLQENLRGKLHSSPFRWLVSCKHYAKGGNAVGTGHEENILERIRQHKCSGFIGMYSTLASSALIERLESLKQSADISEYKIFDMELIRGHLLHHGMSRVLLQYMPESYSRVRPIHPFAGEYHPLHCANCGKDIIQASLLDPSAAIIIFVSSQISENLEDELPLYEEVLVVCRGACDQKIQERHRIAKKYSGWDGFDDFTNPLLFMKRVCALANTQRQDGGRLSDHAFKQYLDIFIAASQLTLRNHTSEELQRFDVLLEVEDIGF